MKWRKRLAEIERLKLKHGKERGHEFPNLKVEQRTVPCSDVIAVPGVVLSPPGSKPRMPHLLVGSPHKQGLQVMSRSDIEWAGGKKPK